MDAWRMADRCRREAIAANYQAEQKGVELDTALAALRVYRERAEAQP